jgi:hypothetical protein
MLDCFAAHACPRWTGSCPSAAAAEGSVVNWDFNPFAFRHTLQTLRWSIRTQPHAVVSTILRVNGQIHASVITRNAISSSGKKYPPAVNFNSFLTSIHALSRITLIASRPSCVSGSTFRTRAAVRATKL